MEKNNFKTGNKNFELYKFIHGMNNDLAIIGSFLTLCHALEGDELFAECLKNSEESLAMIAKMVGEIGLKFPSGEYDE